MIKETLKKTMILFLAMAFIVSSACGLLDGTGSPSNDHMQDEPAREQVPETEEPARTSGSSQTSSLLGRLTAGQPTEPSQNSSSWGRLPTIQQPETEQNSSRWGRLNTIWGATDPDDEEFYDSEQMFPFYEAERMIAEEFQYEGEGTLTRNPSYWYDAIEIYSYELHWYGDNTHYYRIDINSFTGDMFVQEIEYDFAQDMLDYWNRSQG